MTDDIINSAIAEIETPTLDQNPEPIQQEQATTPEPVETPEDRERKLQNAIRYRERKLAKREAHYSQQLTDLQRQVEELKAGKSQPEKLTEDQFESYGDYLKASLKEDLKQEMAQELSQRDKNAKDQQTALEKTRFIEQGRIRVAEKLNEELKRLPDLATVWQENADILDDLPPAIENAFYEADNAPLAIYTLAQEGLLEGLASMSPTRAAIEIGKAQLRGEERLKSQTISKAPTPMASASGTGGIQKTISQLTPEEIVKRFVR